MSVAYDTAAPAIGYRKRRNTELVLIFFALILAVAGWLITNLNTIGAIPDSWPTVAGIAAGVGIALNLLMRWRLPYADPVVLPCVLALNGIGLVILYSLEKGSRPAPNADPQSQLQWTFVGLILLVATVFIVRDYRVLHRRTYILAVVGISMLLLPLLPGLGWESGGARLWIRVGSFTFQPAEIAKLSLAIAFAGYLVDKREVLALAGGRILGIDLPRPRDLGPILVMWGASLAVLIFQRDLGTSLLFFGLFVMMLYVSTERPGWVVLGTGLFISGGVAAYFAMGYVRTRVSGWLDPFSNFNANEQMIQAQFGMAWGGLLGRGLGDGQPGRTPVAESDFIFAAIGEELGVVGMFAVIMIYGLLVARGMRMALASRDPFGKLLASGLVFGLALQTFTIVGGVTRLLPLTGLTTPFMSAGGSSLIANWVLVALLLLISHQVRRPAPVTSLAGADDEQTQMINIGGQLPPPFPPPGGGR